MLTFPVNMMGWAWTAFAFLALIYLMRKLQLQTKKKTLPPAPRMLPIIGNLHLLGKLPHRDLHQLSKKHGPIMYMQLGSVPAIIISSPQSAELFLKKHDLVFASRPPHQAAMHIAYNQTNLSFSPYGSYWREMRKLTLELLTSQRTNSFKSMRKDEITLLMDLIKEAATARVTVDLSARVSSLTTDMSCLMVFGKKYMDEEFDEKGFKAVIQEGMHISAVPNIADFIPLLAAFDLQGLTRRMKAVSKVFDEFFEKIIDEHIDSRKKKGESHSNDFLNIILSIVESEDNEYQINQSHIKATILDLLVASMGTSATTIEWTLSEIILHPEVMKKIQKELETKVGLKRTVEESDLEKLEYLEMVIKETLRLHPVAPLLLPHMSTEDITVDNFHIPKNSRVLINALAIGRDPNAWTDAEKFIPGRYTGSDIDLKGRHFQLIPFGSGRRICPGIQLGRTIVQLALANLVHCFDWELPNGMLVTDLDMSEEFGITIPRVKHLMAVPSYRLLQNISSD